MSIRKIRCDECGYEMICVSFGKRSNIEADGKQFIRQCKRIAEAHGGPFECPSMKKALERDNIS